MRTIEYWVLVGLYSLLLPLHILNTFAIGSIKFFYLPVALLTVYNVYHFRRYFEGPIFGNLLKIGCLAFIPVVIFNSTIGSFASFVLSFLTLLGLPYLEKKHIYLFAPILFLIANYVAYRFAPWPGLPWRYQGLYNDPNYYVSSLIVGTYLCIKSIETSENWIIKGIAIVSILYALYIILLTQSRGGILALGLFALVYIPQLYQKYRKLTVLGLILLVASSGSIYLRFQDGFDSVVSRFNGDRQADINGANSRITEIESAVRGIEEMPIYLVIGSGLGSTGHHTSVYENEHRIHNTIVSLLFENGLIGLLLYLGLFWYLAENAYYYDKVSLALVLALFLQSLTIWVMPFLPFWLGLISTLDYYEEDYEDGEEPEIEES